ncbi:hypothetical protein [Rugamonas rubra]|uniref:Uncharacterized protein n=1 Tax=Rugamonas rubra TaxID=758825 RepID=A0A1I4SJ77_9BURK|nr:hypothetical protein [Rugamonas rubra]SFM64546.1 hypothetical protein SAMN02982985_04812 [Rugamonas rubra]
MLNHRSMGPMLNGDFLVTYATPGCNVPTVVCICTSSAQADDEADRLNSLQRKNELRQPPQCHTNMAMVTVEKVSEV